MRAFPVTAAAVAHYKREDMFLVLQGVAVWRSIRVSTFLSSSLLLSFDLLLACHCSLSPYKHGHLCYTRFNFLENQIDF